MYACMIECMYVCMYVCRYVRTYVCMYVCLCVYVCMHVLCVYVCVCVYILCVCMSWMCVFVYVYMHVCLHVCMYVCMHTGSFCLVWGVELAAGRCNCQQFANKLAVPNFADVREDNFVKTRMTVINSSRKWNNVKIIIRDCRPRKRCSNSCSAVLWMSNTFCCGTSHIGMAVGLP